MSKQNKPWVSASDIGRAEYCSHYLEHKYKGSKVSLSAQTARAKGNTSHEAFNRQAEDKRCFIASHLYGPEDRRTIQLRRYRDQTLRKYFAGRVFIAVYYKLSPTLVTISRKLPVLDELLMKVVNKLLRILDKEHHNV
jgi:hypothetical protein